MSIADVARNALLEENSENFNKIPIEDEKKEDKNLTKSSGKTEETENQLKEAAGTSWEDQ